jgi:hypothetical protein
MVYKQGIFFLLFSNRSIGIWASSEEKDGYFYTALEMHRCKYVATTDLKSLKENQIQYCVVTQRAFFSLNEISKNETNRIGCKGGCGFEIWSITAIMVIMGKKACYSTQANHPSPIKLFAWEFLDCDRRWS